MKYVLLLSVFLSIFASASYAQKFGYVDTDYILKKVPEYRLAEEEIERLGKQWNNEIKEVQHQLDSMELEFKEEELLLTDDMKEKRVLGIEKKRQELRKLQNDYFGVEGLLFLKQQELLKPVQEKVYEAIETVAKKKRLQFMYDKASDFIIVYADPRYDYSDYVLEEIALGDPADQIR